MSETPWRHCKRCRTYRAGTHLDCPRCGRKTVPAVVDPRREPKILAEKETVSR